VWNTHWDHKGQEAREQSGVLMRKLMEEIMGDAFKNTACVLAGDFNCTKESPGTTAFLPPPPTKSNPESLPVLERHNSTMYGLCYE